MLVFRSTAFIFSCISVGYIIAEYLQHEFLTSRLFPDQLTNKAFKDTGSLFWLGNALFPFVLFIKLGLTAICLYAGVYFSNIKLGIGVIFRSVVISEPVFLLAVVIKIGGFLVLDFPFSYQDFQQHYPLSLILFFDADSLDPWWIFPLQALNLFEIAYWIILALTLKRFGIDIFDKALTIVVVSRGIYLFTLITLSIFIIMTLT